MEKINIGKKVKAMLKTNKTFNYLKFKYSPNFVMVRI